MVAICFAKKHFSLTRLCLEGFLLSFLLPRFVPRPRRFPDTPRPGSPSLKALVPRASGSQPKFQTKVPDKISKQKFQAKVPNKSSNNSSQQELLTTNPNSSSNNSSRANILNKSSKQTLPSKVPNTVHNKNVPAKDASKASQAKRPQHKFPTKYPTTVPTKVPNAVTQRSNLFEFKTDIDRLFMAISLGQMS